jgi:hypothetical protein
MIASLRNSASILSLAGGALAYVPSHAAAQTLCKDLPNPVYLQVGDTQEPLMKALGRALRDDTGEPTTLIYVTSGSCTNIEAIYTGVAITKNPSYVPSLAENPTWKTSDPSLTCVIEAGGHAVDIANSALFVSSCNPDAPPSGIGLFQGPVQGYGFIVPEHSSQTAITAEEAYFVFGFGNDSMASPWTDESQMFIRTVTKSTLLTLAATIHVPAAAWRGQRLDKSSDVLSGVLAAGATPDTAEKAIGLLGVELYDKNRSNVNVLAFRAFDQRYAYFPDSTSEATDKRNIRDGHYVPWSPTVWLTQVDGDGAPADATHKRIIDAILGNETAPATRFEPLDLVIGVGLVPDCAMRVTREYEAGPLSLYAPEEPCGCYYDAKVTGTSRADCATCDDSTPCATGTCRHGYCEER